MSSKSKVGFYVLLHPETGLSNVMTTRVRSWPALERFCKDCVSKKYTARPLYLYDEETNVYSRTETRTVYAKTKGGIRRPSFLTKIVRCFSSKSSWRIKW